MGLLFFIRGLELVFISKKNNFAIEWIWALQLTTEWKLKKGKIRQIAGSHQGGEKSEEHEHNIGKWRFWNGQQKPV